MSRSSVAELLEERSVLICVGAGGVGKTTVSATLAMAAARAGRRAVVVTIDPARRLADAMGLDGMTNDPSIVEGDWAGELWAMMLDPQATFDALIERYATDDEQRERILTNRFYTNIMSVLGGSTEYMAVEKLFDLSTQGFDLIVVDTPPSIHSLEFLESPERVHHFVTRRLRWLLRPPRVLRPMSQAITGFLRQAARIVGQEVIDDSLAFLQAFEGMEDGFAARSKRIGELMAHPETGFVLVTSGRPEAAEEAVRLGEALLDNGHRVEALVANRLHPMVDTVSRLPAAPEGSALAAQISAYRSHQTTLVTEAAAIDGVAEAAGAPIVGRLEIVPPEVDAPPTAALETIRALSVQIEASRPS